MITIVTATVETIYAVSCRLLETHADLVFFCINAIKLYIPRVWSNFLDFLAIERKPDQFRFVPKTSVSQERETSIEISAAHSDSMAIIIKSNDGCKNNVDSFRCNKRTRNGFPYSKKISLELCVGCEAPKFHAAVIMYHWCKNALFCAPCAPDDGARVDFVVSRQVTGDIFARVEFMRSNNAFGDYRRRFAASNLVH